MSKGVFKGTENTRLFRVAADKRVPGLGLDRSTNFVVDVGQTIQRVERLSITSVSFPNTFYNVIGYDTSYSYMAENVIYATQVPGQVVTVTIPAGYYNVGTLMAAISAYLNPLLAANEGGDNITFTYDTTTNKVTGVYISTGGTYNVLTVSVPTGPQLTTAGLPPAMNLSSNPFTKLGFVIPPGGILKFISGANVVATNLPSLIGLTKCYLRSQKLAASNSVDESGIISSIMLPIVVSAPFGGLNVFECKVDHLCEIIYSRPVDFNQLDFQLVDRSGNEVNLNGANLQIEFKIWFNNF